MSTKKFPLQPTGGRVVVLPIAKETKSVSGIILPDTNETSNLGTVVAAWQTLVHESNFKVGQRVLFSRYGYETVKLDGIEYYILEEKSILGILQ